MRSLSRKMRVSGAMFVIALVSLAAAPLMAQGYGYSQPQYPQQQPQYSQPQYPMPQYSQSQTYASQSYPDQTYADQQQGYGQQAQLSYAPQGAPAQAMSPDQLEQLVAPIALYPDALVAQILAGATYPAQVAAADQWLRSAGFAGPDQVAAAVNAQTAWDPSIKALTAYPQVIDMLAGNLQWTTALGNAYYNQPQDVLQTVQVMRARAQQAGTLTNTAQMQVVQNQGYIALQPANPDVVYVPTYNPWAVYGAPVRPYPGFSFVGILSTLANAFVGGYGGGGYGAGGGGLQFLASFALGAFNHTPFGLVAWGLDWLFNALTFHHSDYYSHSASVHDWGLPHGGPRYAPRAYPASYRSQWAGGYGGYNHQPISVHGGSGFGTDHWNGNTVRPQGWMGRPQQPGSSQQGWNRTPEPVRPNSWDSSRTNGPVTRGYEPRTFAPQPSRPASPSGFMGGYGNTSRQGNMAYAPAPTQNFRQDRGGLQAYAGGRANSGWGSGGYKEPKMPSYKEPKYSEPKFKEPKMPKMQSYKAPKESHSSGHSSGGWHHR